MKKLLVPTDFSGEAENALKVAAQLAKKYDCEIILLHMIELPLNQISTEMASPENLPEALFFMKLAHQKFETEINNEYLKDITISETVEFNEVSKGILDACEKYDVDLIVMGSHGIEQQKDLFVGSNTEKVVRTSSTPVLVIKNTHEHFDIKEFVFASDFNNDNKETYMQAIKLANLFDAKIHLLNVNTPSNFTTTAASKVRMLEFTEQTTFDNYTINIYNDNTVEKGILNFSRIINADLIGISTHGRQGISHFLNGSISEDLVHHANRPVVTFKI